MQKLLKHAKDFLYRAVKVYVLFYYNDSTIY